MCDGSTLGFLLMMLALFARGTVRIYRKVDNEGAIHNAAKEGVIALIKNRLR